MLISVLLLIISASLCVINILEGNIIALIGFFVLANICYWIFKWVVDEDQKKK